MRGHPLGRPGAGFECGGGVPRISEAYSVDVGREASKGDGLKRKSRHFDILY